MFDYSKLKGRIYERFGNMKNFASALKISQSKLSLWLNERDLTQSIIIKIALALEIPAEEIGIYFFTEKVYKM